MSDVLVDAAEVLAFVVVAVSAGAFVVDAVVTESERSKARQLAARKQASEEHGPFVANAAFRKVNRHELPARQCAASDDDVGEHAEV